MQWITYSNIRDLFLPDTILCPTECLKENLQQVGSLFDYELIYSSYITISSSQVSEIFCGSYPYLTSKVLKCEICGTICLEFNEDDGKRASFKRLKLHSDHIINSEFAACQFSLDGRELGYLVDKYGVRGISANDVLHKPKLAWDINDLEYLRASGCTFSENLVLTSLIGKREMIKAVIDDLAKLGERGNQRKMIASLGAMVSEFQRLQFEEAPGEYQVLVKMLESEVRELRKRFNSQDYEWSNGKYTLAHIKDRLPSDLKIIELYYQLETCISKEIEYIPYNNDKLISLKKAWEQKLQEEAANREVERIVAKARMINPHKNAFLRFEPFPTDIVIRTLFTDHHEWILGEMCAHAYSPKIYSGEFLFEYDSLGASSSSVSSFTSKLSESFHKCTFVGRVIFREDYLAVIEGPFRVTIVVNRGLRLHPNPLGSDDIDFEFAVGDYVEMQGRLTIIEFGIKHLFTRLKSDREIPNTQSYWLEEESMQAYFPAENWEEWNESDLREYYKSEIAHKERDDIKWTLKTYRLLKDETVELEKGNYSDGDQEIFRQEFIQGDLPLSEGGIIDGEKRGKWTFRDWCGVEEAEIDYK